MEYQNLIFCGKKEFWYKDIDKIIAGDHMYNKKQCCLGKKRCIPGFKSYFFQTNLLVMIITGSKIYPPKQPEKKVSPESNPFFIGKYESMPVHKFVWVVQTALDFHRV